MPLPPDFPPAFVVEKTRSLGYGSGPWQREQFVGMWQAPMADKFVTEAKAAGWLVSPSRGTYFVPAAQDLTIVPWLPEPIRSEFLISRTLASLQLPFWCLSSWCRERGLEFGYPLFVTDLGASKKAIQMPAGGALDRKSLREAARAAAVTNTNPWYAEHLIMVPAMPDLQPPVKPQLFLAAEDPGVSTRRENQKKMGQAAIALVGLAVWAFTKEFPDVRDTFAGMERDAVKARAIPYSLGSSIAEDAWIIALLASIGTARVEEFISKLPRKTGSQEQLVLQKWAGLIGPPQPNENWQESLKNGPFPFLFVPPRLWSEMGADQAARRFRMLDRLGVS